jgi:hypothetical protein
MRSEQAAGMNLSPQKTLLRAVGLAAGSKDGGPCPPSRPSSLGCALVLARQDPMQIERPFKSRNSTFELPALIFVRDRKPAMLRLDGFR